METAPLTLAHNHARNAAHETKQNNPLAASEEHELAASEFAAAASGSCDEEAVRILRLLEHHHQKLGEIIRPRHEKPNTVDGDEKPASVASTLIRHETKKSVSVSEARQPPRLPRAAAPLATRELSSSIASNLASARGIPTHRHKRPTPISALVSNQHADGHISQEDGRQPWSSAHSTSTAKTPSWAPPPPLASSPPEADPEDINARFQVFYKQVESIISKLGAPLAFAGLNLASASKLPEQESGQSHPQSRAKSPRPPEADYSQLISRAALRAVNGPRAHKINESFFFVPTSGGTMSYAESLGRRDHTHTRIPSSLTNISEDDFIDARTGLSSAGAKHAAAKAEPTVDGRTMEELALRNQTLQQQLDLVTRRLHAFEMSSQSSTAALAQSIRLMPKSPLASPASSRTHHAHSHQTTSKQAAATDDTGNAGKQFANDALAQRITELEELLRKNDAKTRKKDEENAKLRDTLLRYREKWENLKQGARARREGQQRDKGDKSAGGGEAG
ncbi:hypothetical protein DV736_g2549, partial [Chaetothyriales sp. CBS 134916]